MEFKIKEVPDIQRHIWTNPNVVEAGLEWERREYPLDMKVDFKGKDAAGTVILAEAKNRAREVNIYQVLAQKYRYLYAHFGEEFRNLLVCYRANPEAIALAEEFDIEVMELGDPMVEDIIADYSSFEGFLSRRQFEAFGYLYIERLSVTETANRMGISKPRVSKLKQEIDSRVQQYLGELKEFIAIMMQAPEVFKELLEDIIQVV